MQGLLTVGSTGRLGANQGGHNATIFVPPTKMANALEPRRAQSCLAKACTQGVNPTCVGEGSEMGGDGKHAMTGLVTLPNPGWARPGRTGVP